tara:strand:+ start:4877 stop:5557 length:681 start_codon:yes stop_codon:yes gene_type:complete
MAIKKKDYENLTSANIQRVIDLLEAEKPITKKEACAMLRISYNTTRLSRIIQEHKEYQEFVAKRKAENRGKLATFDEMKSVAQMYIEGFNISDIAKSIYRSPAFVKGIINKIGVPFKYAQSDYDGIRNSILPDQCVSDSFESGEIVWARKRNYPAKVIREHTEVMKDGRTYEEKYGCKCYLLYTIECTDLSNTLFPHLEWGGSYHSCLSYDIGSLRHLEKYGVKFL